MKIKKLLASVLSAAMLVGSIAVGNVSSAFAADITYTPDAWLAKKDGVSAQTANDTNAKSVSNSASTDEVLTPVSGASSYTVALAAKNSSTVGTLGGDNWGIYTSTISGTGSSTVFVSASAAGSGTAASILSLKISNLKKDDVVTVKYGFSNNNYNGTKSGTAFFVDSNGTKVTSGTTNTDATDSEIGQITLTVPAAGDYALASSTKSRWCIYGVTITPAAATPTTDPAVSVERTGSGTLAPTETDTLTATATNFTGGTGGITYKWTSSNPAAATVTDGAATATVTAVATGTTNITCEATKGEEIATSAAVTITVAAPGEAVVTAPDTLQLGYNTTVTATDPANASAAFTFSGTNASATVAADGTVAALAAGDVVVSASATGVEGAKTITVVAPEAKKVPAPATEAGITVDLSDLGTTLGRFNGAKSKSPIVNGTVIHDYITVVDTHSAENIAAIVDAATNAEDFGKAGQDTGDLAGNFENYITYRIDKSPRYVQLSNNALGGLSFTPAANMQVTINYTGSSDTEPTVLQLLEGGLNGTLVAPLIAGTDTAGKSAVNYVANVEKDKTYTIVSKSTGKAQVKEGETVTANGSKPAHVNSVKFTPVPLDPSIEIDATSVPTSVKVGETATVKAAVTDVELTDLEVVAAPTGKVTTGAITAGDEEGTVKFDVTGVDVAEAVTLTLQSKTTATVKDEATLAVTAPDLNPTVTVDKATVDIDADINQKVSVTATPDGFATDASVTYEWTATGAAKIDGDADKATVSITATKGGSGTVKVVAKSTKFGKEYTAEASVAVTATSTKPYVEVAEHDITLYVGQKANIAVTTANFPAEATVEWTQTSANSTIATVEDSTVTSSAVITAVKAGTTKITVKASGVDGDPSADITVTVKELPTITITLDPATAELTVGAEGTTFKATINISDAAAKLSAVEWIVDTTKLEIVSTSDDKKSAVIKGIAAGTDLDVTVSASAVLEGVDGVTIPAGEGKAVVSVVEKVVPEIVAKAKDDKATAEVTIGDETGATLEVEASVSPASVTGITLEKSWVSDNESVVVDKTTGKVTAGANAKAGDTAKVTVTVSAKDNTEIQPVKVEYTVTVKAAPVAAVEEAFALTAVLEDGTAVELKDGVFALPEGTEKFNVVVKAAKGFDANSFTGTLTYDAVAFKAESVAAGTGDVAEKLLTQAILDKALASAADGKIVTIANFAHTDTDLVDVTIAADTVLATFTFSVAAGSDEGAEFAFEAVEIANSDFADTVKAGDKAAIKVSAPVAAADRYYYLLGDANQTGLIDATDAAFVLTNVQKEIADPFEGYANVVDVMEAEPDEGKEFTHIIDATDAAQILVSVQRENVPFTRDISKDVVEAPSVNPAADGATAQFIEVDEATAQAAIAYANANGEDAVANGAVVLNINTAK